MGDNALPVHRGRFTALKRSGRRPGRLLLQVRPSTKALLISPNGWAAEIEVGRWGRCPAWNVAPLLRPRRVVVGTRSARGPIRFDPGLVEGARVRRYCFWRRPTGLQRTGTNARWPGGSAIKRGLPAGRKGGEVRDDVRRHGGCFPRILAGRRQVLFSHRALMVRFRLGTAARR